MLGICFVKSLDFDLQSPSQLFPLCGSRLHPVAPLGASLDVVDEVAELVHALAGVVGVHAAVLRPAVAPLEPVHGTQVPCSGAHTDDHGADR